MYKLTVFTDSTRKIKYLQYNFMKNKEFLRTWAKTQRLSEKFDKQNDTILKNIKDLSFFSESQNVMLFYPLAQELNLLGLLIEPKIYSFPVICENEIVPYKYNGEFSVGKFNIPEPKNSPRQLIEALDIVVIPALCVDYQGYRVGYGKGYYDRFLKKINREKTKCLVAIWDEFVVDKIDANEFDEKVDYIVTEKRVIEIIN